MTRFGFIRTRLLAAPPRGVSAMVLGILVVAIPTLVRASLDGVVSGTTFVAYYPFILFAAIFLGWRIAAVVTFASALIANFLFLYPRYRLFADLDDTLATLLFLLSAGLIISLADALRRSVEEVDAYRKREAHLNGELQHRVKNTLTVVQGLATQTFRGNEAAGADLHKFQSRLRALAQANDILRNGSWEACRLPELAVRALEPFNSDGGISLYGPGCALREDSCVPLVLALHELATNAVKYGALSTSAGTVELMWTLSGGVSGDGESGEGERLSLEWVERGGPEVQTPSRRGLGSRLLKAQPGLKDVCLNFRPEGVSCRIVADGAKPGGAVGSDGDTAAPPTLYSSVVPRAASGARGA